MGAGRRRTLGLAVAVALAVVTAGCGDPAPDRKPGPDLLDENEIGIVETISVDADGFHPSDVTIVANEGLELVNEGDAPHGFDGGKRFGTGLLEPGERSTLLLDRAGEYPFTDPAEPDHRGVIVVEPDPDDPDTTLPLDD